MSSDSMVEPPAERHPIDRARLNAEADDAPSELIHHDEDPMRPQYDGFTVKEVNAPTAILHVAGERQPSRTPGSRLRSIVLGQDTAN